jgi:hypothetical protein
MARDVAVVVFTQPLARKNMTEMLLPAAFIILSNLFHFEVVSSHAKYYCLYFMQRGARGSVVVKALCYKSEGRVFDTHVVNELFSI